MDKNVIDNVKKEQIKIHRITGRMSPLQSTGNLRICAVSTINVSGENDFRNCPLRKFEFYSISHLREGGGMYWSEETGEVELTAPAFIIVPPDILNRYGGANGKKYIEDAVCFYGPLADKLAELGILKPGIFPTSQKRQIPEIQKYFCNPSEQSQYKAAILLQNLIHEICNEQMHARDHVMTGILRNLEQNLQRWFLVSELAEMADMSISTFRRQFRTATGMLPKRYIEELKIHHAAQDLAETDLKISQIAACYGYTDPYHFSRRFKAVTGCSPERYRHNFATH